MVGSDVQYLGIVVWEEREERVVIFHPHELKFHCRRLPCWLLDIHGQLDMMMRLPARGDATFSMTSKQYNSLG
jgi:hypothetical protein